jgi:hypothetical protein
MKGEQMDDLTGNKLFFIGGPGNLSSSAIDELIKRSYQIAVYSNGKYFFELETNVKRYQGDRNDTFRLQEALEDFKPDIILDFSLFTPIQAERILPLVDGKIRQYIFISTVDVYGYPLSRLPFREDDLWYPTTQSVFAQNKRQCETILRSHYHPARFPLTIVRPAYSFGPRFLLSFISYDLGYAMLRRLKTGRPVLVPGDGTTLMHVSAAANTGKMIATFVDSSRAIGKDYTCGHPVFTTHAGYIRLLAHALGVEPNMVNIPTDVITGVNHPEAQSCLLHSLTRYNVAFSIDRFLRDFPEFQWKVTLDNWARQVVEIINQRGILDEPDEDIFDDKIIKAWLKHVPDIYNLRVD